MRSLRLVFAALLATAASVAGAVSPGEYIAAGGWGWMTIDRGESPRLELHSIGPNAHSCAVEGEVRNDIVMLGEERDPSSRCEVTLRRTARGIAVGSELTPACRGYCGIRASFNGEYLRVSPRCTRGAKGEAGAAFLARYRAAKYGEAIASLRPVLVGCAETLEATEAAHLRNDLAVAYFHARERRACVEMLQPLIGPEADRQFEELSRLPADFEAWSGIRAAARTNARLCSSLP